MCVDHRLRVRLVAEVVLADRLEALAAPRLIRDLEVNVRRAEVLLCLRLLILAARQI